MVLIFILENVLVVTTKNPRFEEGVFQFIMVGIDDITVLLQTVKHHGKAVRKLASAAFKKKHLVFFHRVLCSAAIDGRILPVLHPEAKALHKPKIDPVDRQRLQQLFDSSHKNPLGQGALEFKTPCLVCLCSYLSRPSCSFVMKHSVSKYSLILSKNCWIFSRKVSFFAGAVDSNVRPYFFAAASAGLPEGAFTVSQ